MGPFNREVSWWDSWNTRYRAGSLDPTSIPREVGRILSGVISALCLASPCVIEVGCGTGWFAEQIRGAKTYLGLDLSPAAIDVARARVPWGRFEAADFHDWTPADERFDVAILVDSISSFRDQDRAVDKLFEILNPGGYVVLSTVNPFVYSRMSWIGPPGEGQVRRWLTHAKLERLLLGHGFRMLRYFTVMPSGDRGVLRVVNSVKLNKAANVLIPAKWIRRAKEMARLGQYQVAVAQKPSNSQSA